MQMVTVEDVEAARELLSTVIQPTPLTFNRALSDRVGTDVYLKCENLQRAGSFKFRGAYTRMTRLTAQEKAAGVVAASAGNHAQGVALAAQLLGIRANVFMPVGAPMPKLVATRAYGATVELVGQTLDESLVSASAYAETTGAVLIHPFDHVDIVAGQGTCGLEILDQCPDVGTVVVPTGGGGLLAGIATAVRARRPDARVVGAQAARAAAYPASLAAGHPVPLERMTTMADGIAVGCPGPVPFGIVERLVDEIVTVEEEDLSRALLLVLERAKLLVEPAGAAAVAHLIERGRDHDWQGPIVVVLSGGNIDPLLLLRIVRHGMTSAGRYLQVTVRVPDRPGNLARLLGDVAGCDANVVDVEHVRTTPSLGVHDVDISLELETRGPAHREEVLARLAETGYAVTLA